MRSESHQALKQLEKYKIGEFEGNENCDEKKHQIYKKAFFFW